jgi:hypothetical protein
MGIKLFFALWCHQPWQAGNFMEYCALSFLIIGKYIFFSMSHQENIVLSDSVSGKKQS